MAAPRQGGRGRPPLLGRLRRVRPARLVALVLLALALRSLIPVGFMPAADGSLSLMLCPDGLPAALQAAAAPGGAMAGVMAPLHQAHGHGAADESHCNFCTGFSAAPPSPLPAALFLLLTGIAVLTFPAAAPDGFRPVHLPQARAPPPPAPL